MRYYNTSDVAKMTEEKEHQINRYENGIKAFEAIVKDPQLDKWDNKVFNARFVEFINTQYKDLNVRAWKNTVYECRKIFEINIYLYYDNNMNNDKLETDLYYDEDHRKNDCYFIKNEKRIDIEKFKNILEDRIKYYSECLEELEKFDPEKAIKQREEILKQIEKFNESIPSYGEIINLEIF